MTVVFTRKVGRRDVHFTRHAVSRYWQRVRPDLSRKAAREQLKRELEFARVVRDEPPGLRTSRWLQAIAREFLIIDAVTSSGKACTVVFPLNQGLDDKRWIAPTCMVGSP